MPSGRPPKPVWIDGIRYDSTALARIELGIPARRVHEFTIAAERGGIYDGHHVSRQPPRAKRPEAILLASPCKHRLGAYLGGHY